jgi:hypothetical protein
MHGPIEFEITRVNCTSVHVKLLVSVEDHSTIDNSFVPDILFSELFKSFKIPEV